MTSKTVLEWRDDLSKLWHENIQIWYPQNHCGFTTNDQYFAFCAAKDWIQDTGEVLMLHRKQGFSQQPHSAYLEFWGILQAVFIQQDAIIELEYSFTGKRLKDKKTQCPAWHEVRELRNLAVGHPTNKRGGKRSVTGRQGKSYKNVPLTVYSNGDADTKDLDLGSLLDRYDAEASTLMQSVYDSLVAQLAQT